MAPETILRAGERVDGFEVKAVTPLPGLRAVAYEFEHVRSGARLLHVHTEDTENCFAVTFPTLPPDDTGVPHILEHSVLGGSRKYPVKEPFFEMVKMSMATFINAMTGSDCTYYPVASNVKKDLFNLAEVYFDAVFHPLLTEQTFQREGHHLAPARKEEPTGDLTVSGIVYNEMKGAFSNPESRLYRVVTRALFPDTIYGRESGGDPERIPDLTHSALKRFHQTHYHPSNAYFYLYGDIPTAEYLAFLTGRLRGFRRREGPPPIARQPRWRAARSVEESYPIGADEPLTEKTYLTVHWMAGDAIDPAEVVGLRILSLILLGNEAAPLKKAIIDSQLGQDLFFSGDFSVGLDTIFSVGLKGSEPDRVGRFHDLVDETLRGIADREIDRARIDAAFQQAAYDYLEILPTYPLHTLERVLEAWLYGADPLTYLRMGRHLEECRRRFEADPWLFNRLIRERLLVNPHRLNAVMRPDREWQARTDAALAQRMKAVRAKLSDDQAKRLAENAAALEQASGTPNPPEALATLPQLSVRDLPPKPKHIPTTIDRLDRGVVLLRNDVFANGVSYLQLNFDLTGLPAELWTYLPRYQDAIAKLGAAGLNYEQMAQRVAGCTGGVRTGTDLTTHAADSRRPVWGLRFSVKALDAQLDRALEVLRDLIFSVDPRDRERLRDVLVQARAHYRTHMVHNGHVTAGLHAARGVSPEGHLEEIHSGLPQLAFTEKIAARYDERAEELMARIEAIRNFLPARARLTASFTGSDRAYGAARAALNGWIGRMGAELPGAVPVGFEPFGSAPREGLAAPIQVAYCVQLLAAPHESHPDAPLLAIGCRLVGLDYLLSELRFKGNAYGAWCTYLSLSGSVQLGSYRDPHVTRTLGVYDGAADFVRRADWSQSDIVRAIIGTAKEDERPIRPGSANGLALRRHLIGQTPELREVRYERIRSATPAAVKRVLLELFETEGARGPVCVVASRQKLEEANRKMTGAPLAIEDILGPESIG